jgi:hypothetical protein
MLVTPSALVMGLEVAAVRVDLLEEEEEEEEEEESALLRLFRPLLAVAANVDMGVEEGEVGVSGWVVVEGDGLEFCFFQDELDLHHPPPNRCNHARIMAPSSDAQAL